MTDDSSPPLPSADPDSRFKISRRTLLGTAGALLALRAARVRAAALPAPPCFATKQTAYPPPLAKFLDKLDPAADDFPCEQYAAEIEAILAAWGDALRSSAHDLLHDAAAIATHLAPSLRASSLTPSSTVALRTTGPLHIERRSFDHPQLTAREPFVAELTHYLAGFTTLETIELQIYGIRSTSQSPQRVDTDLRCDLVGIAGAAIREQRVGAWHLSWTRDAQGAWLVDRWTADPEIRSRLSGPGFVEITGHCLAPDTPAMAQLAPGIDAWRAALDGASGIDVYGNHGIAVGDIDAGVSPSASGSGQAGGQTAGFDSFYVCQPSGLPNRLYRNRGDGTFADITESSGTGILDGTASALFVDFLNRGRQDLLVVRTGGPLLFVNMGGGRFEPRPDAFHFARQPQGTFTSAAVADYNRDGLLDIYFCVYSYYQGLNQYQYPSPYYDAQNGPPNFLFRNRGDGTFEDVTAASGIDQNNNRFSFAAAWCDYDDNGWPDLYVANDFGRKNLYRSNGDGTFTDIADHAGVEDYGPGMSVCWLDHDNDGRQDLYVANMWLPEGKRITADNHFLPGVDPSVRALYQKHNAGNSFYKNTPGGFQNNTTQAGTEMGRWSWSCASWDFDNDGWADLYVANGFVSGPVRQDLQSFFWRQVAQRSMTPEGVSPDYEMAWNAVNELARSDYSWSGYQRNVCFTNNHDGSFSDTSGVLGLDLNDDCRAYALSDFDHDGRLEFALKNRSAPQLRILRNNLDGIGNSVTFRLIGRTSNRDAIGAVVTLEAGASRQTKFIAAGSGFASQHTKELAFGIGDSTGPLSISVHWPSGKTARYDSVPVHHRVEIEEDATHFNATPYLPSRWRTSTPPAPLTPPPAPATVRTWLLAPLFGPELQLPDLQGNLHPLSALRGKPVLLTFLRPGCGASAQQLQQLQLGASVLNAAGTSIFLVSVAQGDLSPEQHRAAVQGLAQSANVTLARLPIHLADQRAVGAWNIQYRYLFDRRRDLSLPTSFLLDRDGAILCVYQGLVDPASVASDWQHAPVTPEQRSARALPFPGPYYGGPMTHDYLTYGIAFVEYGYLDEAQSAFQRVIDSDPQHESAWFNLGTIYLQKKDYRQASRCLTEAVRLNPQDADAWNNLGMISGEQQRYDDALDQFRHAALANPNHQVAVENMMRLYRYKARPAEAQKTLEQLIAKAPGNADLHLALAMAYVAQDNLDHARDELQTSVRLKPDNPDALNNLGAVLLRMGKSREALEQFASSRRLAPDFDRPILATALIYSNAGQTADAKQVLEEFLARHPDNADVRSALDRLGAR